MQKSQLLIVFLFVFSLFSCVEERLIIEEKELQFDENSSEYQVYQAERAMEYIRSYRFEKLGDVLDKINDALLKQNLQDSLQKYRGIAKNTALFFINEADTLYVFPPENKNPYYQDEVFLGGSFTGSLGENLDLKDSRGTMGGLKNFPETTIFRFYNTLTTKIEGLEYLPDLKSFEWVLVLLDVEEELPDEEFEYVPLQADFSNNHKLEEIIAHNIELGHMIYPKHQLKWFSSTSKITTGSLDALWAKEVRVIGDVLSEGKGFAIKNSKIDKLQFGGVVENLNIAESLIKSLSAGGMETLTLNEGLEELSLSSNNLNERPNFPNSLKKLALVNYLLDPDFSAFTQLDSLIFSLTSNTIGTAPSEIDFNASTLQLPTSLKHINLANSGRYNIIVDDIQLPTSIESIRFKAIAKEKLDLFYLPNLKEVYLYIEMFAEELKLPSHVEKVDMQFSVANQENFIVDLSHLTNINYLRVQTGYFDTGTVTLILPENLTEQALIAPGTTTSTSANIFLKTGSTIVNAPAWLDKYVLYY